MAISSMRKSFEVDFSNPKALFAKPPQFVAVPKWAAAATIATFAGFAGIEEEDLAGSSPSHSSTSRWALIPPKPKPLIAARRGTYVGLSSPTSPDGQRRSHGIARSRIRNGEPSNFIPGAARWKFAMPGKVP